MYKNFIKQHYFKVFKTFVSAICDSNLRIHRVYQSNDTSDAKKTCAKLIKKEIFDFCLGIWNLKEGEDPPLYNQIDLLQEFPHVKTCYPGDLKDAEINLYLKSMIIMTIVKTTKNLALKNTKIKHYKIYNIFPLRTKKGLSHMRLDTKILASNLIESHHGCSIAKTTLFRNSDICKHETWGSLFRMNMLIFDRHGMIPSSIVTNGYSCTILFKKNNNFKNMSRNDRRTHKIKWMARRAPYLKQGYFPPGINILALPNQTDPINTDLVIPRMTNQQLKDIKDEIKQKNDELEALRGPEIKAEEERKRLEKKAKEEARDLEKKRKEEENIKYKQLNRLEKMAYNKEIKRRKEEAARLAKEREDTAAEQKRLQDEELERQAAAKKQRILDELERLRQFNPNTFVRDLFQRDHALKKEVRAFKKEEEKKKLKIKVTSDERTEYYIHTLPRKERRRIRKLISSGKMKIIAIDPGKCDLIYATDGITKDSKFFRYSQVQRQRELKTKKYRDAGENLKKQALYTASININKIQNTITDHKTLDFDLFKEHLRTDAEACKVLNPFYNQVDFRRMEHAAFLNAKRAEQNFIARFKKAYGPPHKVVICIGDYDQQNHMSGKAPCKGRGIRDIFRKYKYKVYLVKEYRTSCRDCLTGKPLVKFQYAKSPRFHIPRRRKIQFDKYYSRLDIKLKMEEQDLIKELKTWNFHHPPPQDRLKFESKAIQEKYDQSFEEKGRTKKDILKDLEVLKLRRKNMLKRLRLPCGSKYHHPPTQDKLPAKLMCEEAKERYEVEYKKAHPKWTTEEFKNQKFLRHGLLRSVDGDGIWNRDRNGAINIYKIAHAAIYGQERPQHLCPETNQDCPSSESPKEKSEKQFFESKNEAQRKLVTEKRVYP